MRDRTAAPAPSRHTGPHACRHAGLGPRCGLLPDLPGPLRRERAGPQARASRAVGRAADATRLQGRRPAGHRRAPALPRGPGDRPRSTSTRSSVGVEPPLPHVRLLHGRPAPRRRRRAARTARRGPRPRDAGRSSTGSSTTRGAASGRSITSSRPGRRRRTATGSTSTRAPSTPAGRSSPTRRSGRRRAQIGYEAWWGIPALPQAERRRPAVREYLMTRRRALAAVRHRRLAARRPRRDPRRRRSGRSSGRAAARSGPTPTSSARSGTSPRSGCPATVSTP